MKKLLIIFSMLLSPWVVGFLLKYVQQQGSVHCSLDNSITYLYKNGDIHSLNGHLLLNTSLDGRGHGNYTGYISYSETKFNKTVETPVNVSFIYDLMKENNGIYTGEINRVSEEIGNEAKPSIIAHFMGSVFISKEKHVTKMYMIDGIKPAWGTPVSPGMVCTKQKYYKGS